MSLRTTSFLCCFILFLPPVFICSCADYVPHERLQLDNTPKEPPEGVYGRLWAIPNPLHLGPLPEGETLENVLVNLFNVGSEDISITGIDLTGDPDFVFEPSFLDIIEEIDALPYTLPGREGCYDFTSIWVSINYEPENKLPVSARLSIQTDDELAPEIGVPLSASIDFPPHESSEPACTTLPIVRPNPIRFDSTLPGTEQYLDVCLHLYGEEGPATITSIEAFGEDIFIDSLTDDYGKPVTTPITYQPGSMKMTLLRLSYRPSGGKPDDGVLGVVFINELGDEHALLVPVLFS